jgi:hypothetical protein
VSFGVGEAERVAVEVVWPGGGRTQVEGGVNRLYEIYAPGVPVPGRAAPADSALADSAAITYNVP